MAEDQTQEIDIDERLAKAAELNIGGDDSDDDDIQMGDFDLEADLRGDKPSPADLRGSLTKRTRANEESDDLEPIADDEEEETEEVEEEVPADEATASTADFDKTFFEKFKAKTGVDLSAKYKDVDSASEGLAHLIHKIGERDQLAEYGRKLLESPQEVFEHLRKILPNLQQQAAVDEPDKPDPNVPAWDDAWLEQVQRDEKGALVPLPGADPSIPAKIAKYQDYLHKRTREIASDPKKALKPLFEKDFAALAAKAAKDAVEQYKREQEQTQHVNAAQAEAWSILQEERGWIYVDGDVKKGPSEAGKIFKKYIDYAEAPIDAAGTPRIPGLKDRRDYAKAKTYEELMLTQQRNNGTQRQARQVKVEKKPVRGAGRQGPARGGWKKGVSLEQALMSAINGAQED